MSPLEKPSFVSVQGAVAAVAARIMARTVLVSVIHHAAVIARDNDECVIGEFQPVQGGEHFSHRPVKLLDGVSPRAMTALAGEPWVWHTGDMNVVRGEIQKKRSLTGSFDELNRLVGQDVGHLFVMPAGRVASRHITDAADAVDDRVRMAVARFDLEKFRMLAADRFLTQRVV